MLPVTLQSIREAAVRIRPLALRTPVLQLGNVYFKCENLQRGGAFKIRGAANLVLSIPEADRPRGVVAFSSGNHAQATAIAAKSIGVPAVIVMPEDAPKSKMEPTRAQGARIVTYNRFTDDREAIAAAILAETGGTLVPPFDHPLIISGQGTAALELLEEVPDLDAIVACVGGGGLLAGTATFATSVRPGIRIFGAEPELASDTYQSFVKGEHVTIPPPDTIADGLRSPSPGKLTFPIIQKLVEGIVLISEDEIRAAIRQIMERLHVIVEPSGAVSAAAVLFNKLPAGLGKIGVIVSGGNTDFDFIRTL
jgi:threonine dehydratase